MSNKIRKEKKTGKKFIALIVVFISVFCCVFFAARGEFSPKASSGIAMMIISPFQRAFSWAGSQLAFIKNSVRELSQLHEQNKLLRQEVELLRAQNLTASEYASENQRLRNLLGYKQAAVQFDLVAASVIGRESSSWSSVIVINRGTLDGVANNMAVVTEMGLVGHVMEAGVNSSKVQLLIDPRSSVGALIQRPESRVAGIVEGDIKNPGCPRMVNIPKDSDVKVEDMVVTSGFGGVYPKGLVVGKIIEIRNEEGGLLKYGVIDTSVDFQKFPNRFNRRRKHPAQRPTRMRQLKKFKRRNNKFKRLNSKCKRLNSKCKRLNSNNCKRQAFSMRNWELGMGNDFANLIPNS